MSAVEVPLAIIGGGPAGLAAAAQAASLGIEALVLDLHEPAGGHYYSLPSADFQIDRPSQEVEEGRSLVAAARQAGAEIWTGVQVWGVYAEDPLRICLSGGPAKTVRARQVILAPGAIERPFPFPGWTLPGVMTAGGALALLKRQQMLPGRRILVAGSGPLHLSAAARLAEAGAQVVAVLELRDLRFFLKAARHLNAILPQRERLSEGLHYLRALRARQVPYKPGWVVTQALGQDEVEGAGIARVDGAGRLSAATKLAVDCICLGYGLLPATQITRLLGCEHRFDPLIGAFVPLRDPWLQTTLPGVFAVGDAAQVAGKPAAALEGQLAALGAAIQLGRLPEGQAGELAAPLRRKLAQEQRFAHALNSLFGALPDLSGLLTPDTPLCRCENVTFGQVRQAITEGALSVADVKYHVRAGMGWCQGNSCASLVAQVVARERGISLEAASRASARPPLFPVSIEELIALEE